MRVMLPAYDRGCNLLKQYSPLCLRIVAVHKSGRNEVRMRSTIVAVLSLFMATAVLAQWEPPDAPQHRPDDGRPPNVYFAHSYFKDDHTAGLDDRISVHVQNFGTLLKNANGNCQGIVLFLDGMPIKGDKPESCDPVMGHVRYRLVRTKDDDVAWHTLLGS